MEKCNLIANSFDNPRHAINFLEKNGYMVVKEENLNLFILNSHYDWSSYFSYYVGKASGEGKKICLLCRNDNDCYAEDWIIDAAHVAVNMETCEEIEMCEL